MRLRAALPALGCRVHPSRANRVRDRRWRVRRMRPLPRTDQAPDRPAGRPMRLAPQIQALFDTAPDEPLDSLTIQEQRQLMRRLSDQNYLRFGLRPEPVGTVTDYVVPAGSA